MEKIGNMLGLRVHNGRIKDKFTMILIRILERMASKLMNSAEEFCAEEEDGPLESRAKILGNEEDKTYREALRLLAKLCPRYEKYLPKTKKAARIISDLLKRRMRLTIWVAMGNEIPLQELNAVLVKNLLKEKRYAYRRKKGEMGWYLGGLFVGENLFDALGHLEEIETIDRSRLTVSF